VVGEILPVASPVADFTYDIAGNIAVIKKYIGAAVL